MYHIFARKKQQLKNNVVDFISQWQFISQLSAFIRRRKLKSVPDLEQSFALMKHYPSPRGWCYVFVISNKTNSQPASLCVSGVCVCVYFLVCCARLMPARVKCVWGWIHNFLFCLCVSLSVGMCVGGSVSMGMYALETSVCVCVCVCVCECMFEHADASVWLLLVYVSVYVCMYTLFCVGVHPRVCVCVCVRAPAQNDKCKSSFRCFPPARACVSGLQRLRCVCRLQGLLILEFSFLSLQRLTDLTRTEQLSHLKLSLLLPLLLLSLCLLSLLWPPSWQTPLFSPSPGEVLLL